MAKTTNYQWDLPSPSGIQIAEIANIATTFVAIDLKVKSFETALSTHKHAFGDLTNRPTTLGGYGITDGMTAVEVAEAIKNAVDALLDGSVEALDTLKELGAALGNDPNFAATVSAALGLRVRVDAASNFSVAQKTQGRANIDALGTVDKGAAGGVASLDSGGKVPAGQLPALTTTATVGAAVAGANGQSSIADGDSLTGVLAGTGTLVRWTWGNIVTWLRTLFYTKTEVNTITSNNMSGRAYPRLANGNSINLNWSGQSGQPTWLFGGGDPSAINVYNPSNFNVNYANSAGNANTVGGWDQATIADQLNWRVTDTRFAGYVEGALDLRTGVDVGVVTGANGYVLVGTWRSTNTHMGFAYRQMQRYIPNQGWRAMGTW